MSCAQPTPFRNTGVYKIRLWLFNKYFQWTRMMTNTSVTPKEECLFECVQYLRLSLRVHSYSNNSSSSPRAAHSQTLVLNCSGYSLVSIIIVIRYYVVLFITFCSLSWSRPKTYRFLILVCSYQFDRLNADAYWRWPPKNWCNSTPLDVPTCTGNLVPHHS